MSMSFSGQVALVTGAANGIGRATAQAFASAGLKVVVSDVDVAGGEQTVELIRQAGGEALFVRCDVSRDAEVQALMATLIEVYGRLDYAFNNAGIEIEKGRLNEGSEAEFKGRTLLFPFTLDELEATLQELEDQVDEAWKEANE